MRMSDILFKSIQLKSFIYQQLKAWVLLKVSNKKKILAELKNLNSKTYFIEENALEVNRSGTNSQIRGIFRSPLEKP